MKNQIKQCQRHIKFLIFLTESCKIHQNFFFSTVNFLSRQNKNYIYKKIRHIYNTLNNHEKENFELPKDKSEGITIDNNLDKLGMVNKNYYIYHFGNGDEKDRKLINDFFNKLGILDSDYKLYIFPGMPYGHIKIINLNESLIGHKNIYKCIIKTNQNEKDENNNENFIYLLMKDDNLKYYLIETRKIIDEVLLFIKRNLKGIDFNQNLYCQVEGLYIIENFISEDDERNLIEESELIRYSDNDIINIIDDNHNSYLDCKGILSYKDIITKIFKEKINDITKRLILNIQKSNNKEENYYTFNFDLYNKTNLNNTLHKNHYIDNDKCYFKLRNNMSFNQIYINKYFPGKGRNNTSPFCQNLINDIYFVVNIGSNMIISLNEYNNKDNKKQVELFIKPRSILIFTNDSRYKWYYSIKSRKYDLVNEELIKRKDLLTITFLYLNNDQQLFSQYKYENIYTKLYSSSVSLLIKSNISQKIQGLKSIEQTYVYNVNDKIAYHFSSTRYKPWPKIVKFINDLNDFTLIGDIGCGNGKYISYTRNKYIIGCDISQKLIEIAYEKNKLSNLIRCNSLLLPIRDNVYDVVISIAVIHHFSSMELRKRSIQEMKRVVKKDGLMLVYVWAYEQDSRNFIQQENLVPWFYQKSFNKDNSNKSSIIKDDSQDKIEICYRYYYVFKSNELEDLIISIGGLEIIESFYDKENWCCLVKKI